VIARREPAVRPAVAGTTLAPALEFTALGLALTLVVSLMARVPSWFHDLGVFQGLYVVAFAIYALALLRLKRYARLPRVGLVVAAVAIAARIALLPVPPTLSGDIHRYVWEGRVVLNGGNPYLQSPSDPALAPLRDRDIYPDINHKELRTIYPPLAMAEFTLMAWVWPTVLGFKAWVLLHEVALVLLLITWLGRRGESAAYALVYAWNPLMLVEFAGTGHMDPTAMVWLVLALMLAESRPSVSALALAAGSLVKLAPLAALPFLWMRWPWRARLVALALLVPGLAWFVAETRGGYSGLLAYWGTWRNNELVFAYLDRWTGGFRAARAWALAIVVGTVVFAWARRVAVERATAWVAKAATLVSPVLHPWYLGWSLVLEPFTRSAPWLLLSLTVILNYGVFATPAEGRAFHLPLAWRWLEYGVPLLMAVVLAWRARRGVAGDRVAPRLAVIQ
jgi:Glycosyltransferase family 87